MWDKTIILYFNSMCCISVLVKIQLSTFIPLSQPNDQSAFDINEVYDTTICR